jgi:hypothetical protein
MTDEPINGREPDKSEEDIHARSLDLAALRERKPGQDDVGTREENAERT